MEIRVDRTFDHIRVLIVLLIGWFVSSVASAQQPIVPLQLSFSDPGARSMGFGGAFVALADDATAAFANPAGLAQLLRPEISIEGRFWGYSTPFTEGGRAEGLPSGNGIDSTIGLRTSTSDEDIIGLSFVSLAYPIGNWSIAFFRHEYANLEFFGETQGLFTGGTDCCQIREFDQRSASNLDFVSYGFSAAYRVSDRLNVGFGLVHYDASLESLVSLYSPDDDSVQSIFSRNSYLPERSVVHQRSYADDTDWTISGGILWRASENWRIGAVYRQGLETRFDVEQRAGEAIDLGVAPGELIAQGSPGNIEFPDIYGLGFAYRAPDGRLTVSFQWDRVEYSDIPRSLRLDDQTIEDADELHLGAEYVFIDSTPIIAVRLGTWFEPDHQMYATIDEPLIRAFLPRGEDEIHYTAGLGLAMRRFQIDVAVDFADRADTISLSTIYSFR